MLDDATLSPAAGSRDQRIRGPYLQSAMYRRAAIDTRRPVRRELPPGMR